MQLASKKLRILAGAEFAEHHAAEELQKYLAQITGVTLPICIPDGTTENSILIGAAAPLSDADRAALKLDGFIIRTLPGNSLMLAGLKPISSLYAVYALLENYCGCGFFDDGDQVPVNPELTVGEIDLLDNPRFELRPYFTNGSLNYGGLMWYSAAEIKKWIDTLLKKRMNVLFSNHLCFTSILPEALNEMGYDIHPEPYQLQKTEILSEVFLYAEQIGIQIVVDENFIKGNAWGNFPAYSNTQISSFIQQYDASHTEPITNYTYEWCDFKLNRLDLRHPEVHRLYTTCLRLCKEKLHTGNYYYVSMPTEGGFSREYTLEDVGQMVKESFNKTIEAIHEVDPSGIIFVDAPFPHNTTYPYQREAIKRDDIIIRETYLDQQAHHYDYELNNFYDGAPWMGGTLSHCANETNPNASTQFALNHIQTLIADPRAEHMMGFSIENEKFRRNIFANDLYFAMAWNPEGIQMDTFIRDYTRRRYGSDVLLPAVQDVVDTLYSSRNRGMENCVQYRNFHSQYLCGLVAESVKISIGYLPTLHRALKYMLEHGKELENNDRFRLDVVDLGRTYLGFFFNLYFAGARLGGYYGDIKLVREYAPRALAVMDDIAKLCSAHEEFRLQSFYDRADKYYPVELDVPEANRMSIFWLFTNLFVPPINAYLRDYMAEDFTELVTHYYKPQIELYFKELDDLVAGGGKLSGRLMDHLLYADLPNRCFESAPPKGKLHWSGFGAVGEPELIHREEALRDELIHGPYIADESLRHDGPILPLLAEILDKYTVTDEIDILLSKDPEIPADELDDMEDPIINAKIGETVSGIPVGIIVESYVIDSQILMFFECTVMGTEYNILRGSIKRTRIRVSTLINFTRLEDIPAVDGNGMLKQFSFKLFDNEEYILVLDQGSDSKPASICVKKA